MTVKEPTGRAMKDREIENLIRMAVEIDELEQRSLDEASRASGAARGTIRLGERRASAARWWIGLSAVAAAACLLLLLWPRQSQTAPPTSATPAVVQRQHEIPVEIDYCPALPRKDGIRIDRFEPSSPESCSVLAIFHSWHEECKCLTWELDEWEDGRPLAEFSPGRVLDIALDVTGAPPLQQLLVVAIAKDPGDLPSTDADTCELLQCLNEVRPPTDPGDSPAAYGSAVRACLPESVTVVPQPFFVE